MKTVLRIILVISALAGLAAAEPIKCVINGKTFYTDDLARCPKGSQQPIADNLTIMSFPKAGNAKQANRWPALDKPSWLDNLTLPEGFSKEDLKRGWETIMDARKRGAWQSPVPPNEKE